MYKNYLKVSMNHCGVTFSKKVVTKQPPKVRNVVIKTKTPQIRLTS